MKKQPRLAILASPLLVIAAISLAGLVFILDTITDLDVAVEVLYVAVVLIAVRIFQQRTVVIVSLGCIALTILSGYLSMGDVLGVAEILNSLIGIAAIIVTTYLGLKNQSAEMALQDARAALAHFGRVATLGELTAAITHEVNQPIGGVVTNAEAALRWLAARPPELEEVHQALEAVVDDGKRASAVVARIRALLVKSPARHELLDINQIGLEVVGLMRNEIKTHRILLKTLFSTDLPRVLGDRVQLQQVLLNLMLNAIEAMSAETKRSRELIISTEKQNENTILVTVRDSGKGLAPAGLDRVFEAFYTTKPGGIGMGLSICRSIVEAHGGHISASSTDHGASFYLSLPVAK